MQVDNQRELVARQRLLNYLTQIGQKDPERNANQLLNLESGMRDRFLYLKPFLDQQTLDSVLVSGCSVGTEMLLAREYGFKRIHGTEIEMCLASIAAFRFEPHNDCCVLLYDGLRLPYEDGVMNVVISGHIIEHTALPFHYLKEHLRVLATGGILFIVFPNRYHLVELHTGLPSFEFLPLPIRNAGLRIIGTRVSPFRQEAKQNYRAILGTLQPISRWQIIRFTKMLRPELGPIEIVHSYFPRPGYVRMVLKRKSGVS